jgi:prepilin-type N-terminal cleavage/methylation domain-containing protein
MSAMRYQRARFSARRRGFTIAEMLLCMVVAGALMTGFYGVMTKQGRGYNRMVVSTDADETARSAAAVLAWELRQAAIGGNTLVGTLDAQSVTVRSVQGVGIVCAKSSTDPRYAIWKNGGDIQATADDTAMVYAHMSQAWRRLKISAVGTPADYSMTSCAWGGGRTPDLVVEVSGFTAADTAGIVVGSPFRAYRQVQYGVVQSGGRYWLGRKISPSSGSYQILTGPLRGATGLRLAYYSSSGAVTATASQVAMVKITVLTESYKQYRDQSGTPQYRYDSLTTRVALR